MKKSKISKEILPLPTHPATPMLPPEHRPHQERKQTHEPPTEVRQPCYPEFDILHEEEERIIENEPVAE
jgi:hypothetical protein